MNLKNISDQDLLDKTENLVKRERELLSEVLHHLKEIERRRLFSQLGFKSLFDYATKKLGYGEDQAARRISAMRLLKELPEIESKICDGSLTLTNLSMAQSLFRQENKKVAQNLDNEKTLLKSCSDNITAKDTQKGFNKEQKLEFLSKIENKSKREAEKLVISYSTQPEQLHTDRIRVVTENHVEIKFIAGSELQEKLEKVKGLLAHSHPNMNMAEAINLLCDMAIQRLDPAKKAEKKAPAPDIKRRITVQMRKQVWQQAQSKCQNCGSTHALQVDHIHPKSVGGSNGLANLRLLCRPCNQRAAINRLGLTKMQRFIDGPVGG